ncbi:hypothetical protein AWE51_16530 [Aquimarina aggregata]|uniref:Tetratricopeptide repeat protein n=1 Tax=Aquimarina aggregata TaxID=1642818 RepID=A0A163D2Y6_9FLAO|nr:hypothetical protein [Aquimarina aggregata]KZS42955.1 hypothetical protein AWE51_16530 [Aquimarina aggregata]
MNTKELTYLLKNPAQLSKEQAYSLEKISREFPYFQSIKPLLLKTLKDNESFRYNQELKTTAAYTIDRTVLFDFITSDLFKKNNDQNVTPKKTKSDIDVVDPTEVKVLQRMAMDDAVRMKIKEAEDVLDPALFAARNEESLLNQISKTEEIASEANEEKKSKQESKTTEQILGINKPLDFDKKETHSFAEWLKLSSLNPIAPEPKNSETEKKEDKKLLDQKDKFDLIDEFIASNPKIKPAIKNAPTRNLAKQNVVPTDELMTETLARVYLAQKNYKKAIQAYNILILKNPEKSGFFADQIRAIKKLQENK